MEIMKNHTLIGERILSVAVPFEAGRYYSPSSSRKLGWQRISAGLAGKRIPLGGRLTALADVFDALLSDRPYKKAWDFERAIKYVQQESGKKFDPEMVDTLIKNIQKIRLIYSGTNNSDEVFQKTTH